MRVQACEKAGNERYVVYLTHRENFSEVGLDMRNRVDLFDESVDVNNLMLILGAHLRPQMIKCISIKDCNDQL